MSTFHKRQFEKIQSEILLNNPDMKPPNNGNETELSMKPPNNDNDAGLMSTFHEREFEKIQSEILLNNPDMKPPNNGNEAGLSMPMDKVVLKKVTLVASHFVHGDLKFVKISEDKILGKYTVFLFMDQNITQDKKNEWMEISMYHNNIKSRDSRVFGVMPISHRRVSQKMKKDLPVHFPVISDNNGKLAEAFGVGHSEDLVGKSGQVGFAILDKTMKMRYLSLDLQSVPISTKHILTILDKIKETDQAEELETFGENIEKKMDAAVADIKEGFVNVPEDFLKFGKTVDKKMNEIGADMKEGFDFAGEELTKFGKIVKEKIDVANGNIKEGFDHAGEEFEQMVEGLDHAGKELEKFGQNIQEKMDVADADIKEGFVHAGEELEKFGQTIKEKMDGWN